METLKFLKKMMEDEMKTSKEFSIGSDEEFIKELSEAIAELEELHNRRCENCRHFLFYSNSKQSGTCDNEDSIAYTSKEAIYYDDGCNKWEA